MLGLIGSCRAYLSRLRWSLGWRYLRLSWTRAGHLAAKILRKHARTGAFDSLAFCTARLSAYFSSRRTRLVTLFFAWFLTARVPVMRHGIRSLYVAAVASTSSFQRASSNWQHTTVDAGRCAPKCFTRISAFASSKLGFARYVRRETIFFTDIPALSRIVFKCFQISSA